MKRRGAPYGSTGGHENHCVKHSFYAVIGAFQKGAGVRRNKKSVKLAETGYAAGSKTKKLFSALLLMINESSMNKDPFACRRKHRLYAKFFANTAARKTAHIEFGVSRPRPVGCQENIRAVMSRIVAVLL